MNRQFTIIISIATFLLIALLIALSIFRSSMQPSEQTSEQVAFPTSVPRRSGNGNSVNNQIPIIPKEKQNTLTTIQSKLPYSSESFDIDYSNITDKIYVQEKTEKAAADLQKFLEDNQLLDLYKLNPELFVISKKPVAELIIDEEQERTIDLEQTEELESFPTPTNSNPDEAKIEKQLNIFKGLFNLGIAGNIVDITPRPTVQVGTTTNQTSSPVGNFQSGFPVTPSDTTKIPCPVSPTVSDNGVRRIYANGVGFYNIRLCKVHGLSINSVKAKDFDGMITSMKSSGYNYGGGSFRTQDAQIAMHQGNPNGSAAGGSSNHERGLAVDSTCSNKDGTAAFKPWMSGKARGLKAFAKALAEHPCLRWIHNNSSRYGLLLMCDGKGKYGEIAVKTGGCETWHLSPTGH